jgi:rhodanese-related sulfurtransferase
MRSVITRPDASRFTRSLPRRLRHVDGRASCRRTRANGGLHELALGIALSSYPMPIPIQGPLSSDVPVRTIERDAIRRRIEAKDPRFKLVMALADWEFRAKHIPGSLHFKDASEMLSALRRDDEIVVYCTNPPCLASVAAYHRLVQEGYTNVRRYAGGIEDWEAAGLPLERGVGDGTVMVAPK